MVAGHGAANESRVSPNEGKRNNGNAVKGERDVIFDGKAIRTALYDAAALRPGYKIEGPAMVEHEHSCTALAPGSSAMVDAEGNLTITV